MGPCAVGLAFPWHALLLWKEKRMKLRPGVREPRVQTLAQPLVMGVSPGRWWTLPVSGFSPMLRDGGGVTL